MMKLQCFLPLPNARASLTVVQVSSCSIGRRGHSPSAPCALDVLLRRVFHGNIVRAAFEAVRM
jgi:hypothetical protein